MKPDEFLLVFSTAPSREAADGLARGLVERGLAACVTVLPGAASTYRWQGTVEQADELVLLIKAPRARWGELEAAVADLHPYDVPELIAVPLAAGAGPYLDWLKASTQ
jgi:periplasmic divalent cation tolerance protein